MNWDLPFNTDFQQTVPGVYWDNAVTSQEPTPGSPVATVAWWIGMVAALVLIRLLNKWAS